MKRKLKYFDLLNELNAGKIHQVYFLTEEESFLKDKTFELLQKKIVSQKYKDFNLSVFFGEEAKSVQILEALRTPPVLSDKKLVILRNFQSLHISDKNRIINYIEHPIRESVLVIETGKVNLRTDIYAKLLKKVPTYYFYHPYNENDAERFLQIEARKHNKLFSEDALKLMVDYIGLNYQELNNELQKLVLFLSDKNRIEVDDINSCIITYKGNSIYELQDALAKKDIKLSMRILENLLANDISPILIIIMITKFFKTIWKITILTSQNNQNNKEIENNMTGFYKVSNLIRQASKFNLNDFPKIFHILLDTDYKLKSLSINKKIILELMIYRICRNV